MATTNARETRWAKALRAALDDVLLDVRYLETPEGVDFLLVHADEQRRDAVHRFTRALRESGDVPPFGLWARTSEHAGAPDFAAYESVKAA